MSRCLSEDALLRLLAELSTADERAHLAMCPACAERHRQLTSDVNALTHVLLATREPLAPAAPAARRWVPVAAALAALAVGALIWVEVAVWRAIQPTPEPPQMQQVAAVLADVSSSLFSVDGEPGRVLADNPLPALARDDDLDTVLGEPEPECAGALCGVEGFTEAAEDTGG